MQNPKVRIESDGFRTEIYVDRVKVNNAIECDFHAAVGCATCTVRTYLFVGFDKTGDGVEDETHIIIC